MNTKMRILGVATMALACTLFTAQAFAERGSVRRDRGSHGSHQVSSHNNGHQSGHQANRHRVSRHGGGHTTVSVNVGGHHGNRHNTHYRRHRNGHLLHAAAYVIGGLSHGHHRSGYYDTQRVLVRDGYYENYEVHVPRRFDEHSHRWIPAHYETRTRWIQPVYEYRDVWIPGY